MTKSNVELIMDSNCDTLRIAASYNEWTKMGCQVLKGQTSLRHRNGVAQFEIWQTIPVQTYEELERQSFREECSCYDYMSMFDEEQYH